jgi:hypothetical protein
MIGLVAAQCDDAQSSLAVHLAPDLNAQRPAALHAMFFAPHAVSALPASTFSQAPFDPQRWHSGHVALSQHTASTQCSLPQSLGLVQLLPSAPFPFAGLPAEAPALGPDGEPASAIAPASAVAPPLD